MNNNKALEMAYAMWRFEMWLKGYGTYSDIDEAVSNDELIPGKNYPKKTKEVEKESDAE